MVNVSMKQTSLTAIKSSLPPHNKEAEQSILAAMFLENDCIYDVLEELSVDDFYDKKHTFIFEAVRELFDKNGVIDVITVAEVLRRKNHLYDVGDIAYLTDITSRLVTAAHVMEHSRIVRNNALLRRLISSCTSIIKDCYETQEVQKLIDQAEAKIFDVSRSKEDSSLVAIKDQVDTTFDEITKIYENKSTLGGLSSGFKDLDTLISGLNPSEFIVLAARPSMGKTALASSIMEHTALVEKKTILFFSLEMSKESLVQRMLCSYARVSAHHLKKGFLNEQKWIKLTEAAGKLSKSQIFIDDAPGINMLDMKRKARRLKSQKGLDLILVDYLQLMQSFKKTESRQQEISEISRSLKGLARELKVPVIALSQLSRAVEARTNKTPLLSDLRESGAIEQDADVVLLLMREEYYNPTEENKNLAQLIVGKNRNGPTGKVNLVFLKEMVRFENRSSRPQ